MMEHNEIDILLVEDNPDDLELTLHALRREHLANNIFAVRDGEEAVEFLFCTGRFQKRNLEHPPRLVLLDLKLPKLTGLEVLKLIVILTSSKEERDLVASYNLGANSYIQKPVDFDTFREIVKSTGLYWMVINQRPLSNPVHAAKAAAQP
jgi:two-component system, response regulator